MSARLLNRSDVARSNQSREDDPKTSEREKNLKRKIDWRLCTIGGLLTSLNLIDSGIISSASVTSMLHDLQLDQGNRFSLAILIFTVSSVCFQLPATIAVRLLGPRIFFSCTTICFGVIALCTAFVHNWKEMILMRVLLGIFMVLQSLSGIFPGLALLVSSWYKRGATLPWQIFLNTTKSVSEEQQLRFAFLQVGEVVLLASGNIANFGVAVIIGLLTYFWIVDFPENAQRSFHFLDKIETELAVSRIQRDRGDVIPEPFSWSILLRQFLDIKIYGFAASLFLLVGQPSIIAT
ncbi:hypothetical protein MMC07_003177 [Pseudocyphellaria aurata]|nr:hypothetical protein [Pseudocyphellaria aurata]